MLNLLKDWRNVAISVYKHTRGRVSFLSRSGLARLTTRLTKRKMGRRIEWLCLLLGWAPVSASQLPLRSSTSAQFVGRPKERVFQYSLGGEWQEFNRVNPEVGSSFANFDNEMVYEVGMTAAQQNYGLDITIGASKRSIKPYTDLAELYGTLSWSDFIQAEGKSHISLGRKKYGWSALDEDWRLGLWQPIFNQDLLRPSQQGLVGLFSHTELPSQLEILAFASSIFIPSLPPEIIEDRGALRPVSRWQIPPASQGQVFGRPTAFRYRIRADDLEQVVFKPSYGLGISWGATSFSKKNDNQEILNTGPWVKIAWAEKPLNTLGMAYDYNLFISDNDQAKAGIEIKPISYRGQIYQAELGWQVKNFRIYSSFLQEIPMSLQIDSRFEQKTSDTPREWIFQKARPVTLWGGGLSGQMSLSSEWSFNYLKVFQSRTQDFNTADEFRGETSPFRLHFEEAIRMKLTHHHSLFKTPVTSSFEYTRDFLADGHLLQFLQAWRLQSSLQIYGGIDVIGVTDLENKDANQFFSRYRANDRIFGGLKYVF